MISRCQAVAARLSYCSAIAVLCGWMGHSAAATIVVSAAGDLLGGVGPKMTVRVNGEAISPSPVFVGNTRTVGYKDFTFNTSQPIGKDSIVDVQFMNDDVSATEDRNLWVQWIKVDGTQYLPTGSNVWIDQGKGAAAFDGQNIVGPSQMVPWNAALRFKMPTSPALGIVVEAAGSKAGNIWPRMEVSVNGVLATPVGATSPVDVNNLLSAGYKNYSFTSSQSWVPGSFIDVRYTNDGATATEDRNLFVNSVSVNGVKKKSTDLGVVYDVGNTSLEATDGLETMTGRAAMAWGGALRFKAAVNVPGVTEFTSRPASGPITVTKSNITISGLRVSNPAGYCIYIAPGVTNVEISDNEIGPCGDGTMSLAAGVFIEESYDPITSNIRVIRNYIHDAASGVVAQSMAAHPIIVDRNRITIRGPFMSNVGGGTAVLMRATDRSSGSGPSRVLCNVSDATANALPLVARAYEDHFNFFKSKGSANERMEIAYNKLRGGNSNDSGSGMVIGDGAGEYQWAHHNVIVDVAGVGIGVSGGKYQTIEYNRIYNNINSTITKSRHAVSVANYVAPVNGVKPECKYITLTNNVGFGVKNTDGSGAIFTYYRNPEPDPDSCSLVTDTPNTFYTAQPAPTVLSSEIFDDAIAECDR